MATARAPSRTRTWLAVAAIAVVVLGLTVTVVALLVRPGPATAQSPAPGPTPVPAASEPGSSPSPSSARQEQQRYRAYVSMVATNGTALAGSMAGLQACRESRALCKQRIAAAAAQVEQFQRALSANPAPACLSTADQRLRDGLSFQGRGLGLAESAIDDRNRVMMAQGLILMSAGTWREAQAIRSARQSDC